MVENTENTVQIGKHVFRVACDKRPREDAKAATRRSEAIARWLLAEWRRRQTPLAEDRPCAS